MSRLTVQENSDVVIAGGGPAGVAAAIASARAGAKTTLLEVHGCLGGVWTAGQLCWIFEGDNSGIATEIADRLQAMKARSGGESFKTYSYDVETMKYLCEKLCLDAGVRVRLHTRVVDAVLDGDGKLAQVVTESKSGRELWPAKAFVDCSGDGDLGAYAGCSFEMGGPGGQTQPFTMMGLITVKDLNSVKEHVSFLDGEGELWAGHAKRVKANLELMNSIGGISYEQPTIFHVRDNLCALMINHQYKASAIDADDVTKATLQGREEVFKVVEKLRALGGKWEGVTLAATAEQIGIRDARRLRGLYSLTDEDLIKGAKFEDVVCKCDFGVDVHSPDPDKDKGLSHMGMKTKPYQIPYRCLVAKDVKGLLMAGRCISGGWLPHASYRVTGTAVSLGEAAGKAAAFSAKSGKLPSELSWQEITSG